MELAVLEYRIFAIEEFIKDILHDAHGILIRFLGAQIKMIAIHEQRFIDIGKSARVRRRIDLGHDIHAIFFRVFLIRFIGFLRVDLIFWQPFIQLRIHFAFHPERHCLFAAIIIDVIAEFAQLEIAGIACQLAQIIERDILSGYIEHDRTHRILRIIPHLSLRDLIMSFIL